MVDQRLTKRIPGTTKSSTEERDTPTEIASGQQMRFAAAISRVSGEPEINFPPSPGGSAPESV